MDRNDPRDPRTNPNINNDDIPTRMTENPGARPYGEETGQYPILEERGFSAYDAHNDPYPYTDSTDFQSQPPRTPTGGWANQDVVDNQYDEPASETEDPEMDAFLFTLGCYSGEEITLVARRRGGCVVSIKDGRYNIDTLLADAIQIQDGPHT